MKMNKKLILLIILVLIMGISVGCSKTPKAPEGVNQEFYDDMIDCLKKLEKHKGDKEKNGIEVIKDYKDNKLWLTVKEEKIIEAVDDLYFSVWSYHIEEDTTSKDRLMLIDDINKVSELMELDIDTKKLAPKK